MPEPDPSDEKLTMANTKKEMLDAYNRLLKQLREKRRAELKPAEAAAEKRKVEAKAVADSLSTEHIGRQIGLLKSEIGKTLNELADRLEAETSKYTQVKKAVEDAEAELREIYEIEKAASSLAALLEAQRQEREEFETEIATAREEFEAEMETARDDFETELAVQREEWKKEKAQHEAMIKDRNIAEQKQRQREQEDYKYQFDREKQLTLEAYEHEKAKLEREIHLKKEALEKVLAEREAAVAAAENELKQLREKVEAHPAELDKAVSQAVKDTTERIQRDSNSQIALMEKEFAGERNVLNSRIESLQDAVKKQSEQIATLSQQLEHSYRQVQDIAVKAIEGPSRMQRPSHTTGAIDLPSRMPDER